MTDEDESGYELGGEHGRKPRMLKEAAAAYGAPPRPSFSVVGGTEVEPERRRGKVKTSVYLERSDTAHLAWLAEVEGRPQAEIVRDAIRQYRSTPAGRGLATFNLFDSGEGDGRSIADIPEEELFAGFGDDGPSGRPGADEDR